MIRERIWETPEPCIDFRRANDSLTGVLSARKFMVGKRAAIAALAVQTVISDQSGSSIDMFVVELGKMAERHLQYKCHAEQSFC